jgi:hypothetical protein
MKTAKTIILVICASLFFFSCKKDDLQKLKASYNLSLQFNDNYMPLSRVDSAIATWEVNGSKKDIKLTVKENKLAAPLTDFPEGTGKLTITVYSTIRFSGLSRSDWALEKEVDIRHVKEYEYKGPDGFTDPSWKPRVVLTSPLGHKAVVALRPDDAYFRIINVGDEVEKLTVHRAYWDLSNRMQVVAEGDWACQTGCRNNNRDVLNNSYFTFFPSQLDNKFWDAIRIEVSYRVPVNMTIYVSMTHQF